MSREVGGYQELESIFTERIITNGWYEKSNLGWKREYWTKIFEKKAFHFFKKIILMEIRGKINFRKWKQMPEVED